MPSLLEKVFSQHREDVEVTAQDVVREKECHSPQAYAPLGLSCVAMCPGHKINSHKNQVTSFWQSVSSKRRQMNYMISGFFFSYVSRVDFIYKTLQNIQAYMPQKLVGHIATSNSIIQLLHSHDCANN